MNVLDIIVEICDKEIKEEDENIRQVILAILSAWTDDPQNLRILAPSGEGKTYLVLNVAKLFSQKNIIILNKATPQSFKYYSEKKVVEVNGQFEDFDEIIKSHKEELSQTADKTKIKNIKEQIKEIERTAYDFVDLSGKVLIFVDSQSFELWESLKTSLSHDQKDLKNLSVNKSNSGKIQGHKILFHGFPAVIYCSAKDEHSQDITDEISTRFNTISLNASQKKYRKMLELQGLKQSIPDVIYQEEVINDVEYEKAKQLIEGIIYNIEKFRGQTINPFEDYIQSKISDDAGYRTRQLGVLLKNIRLHTLCNAKYRPKFTYKGQTFPISTIFDVLEANKLTKKPIPIQPAKILYFNKYIRPAIFESGKEKTLIDGNRKCLTGNEIADYLGRNGIIIDRKKLHENYLKPLSDFDYLEEFQDPDRRNRNIYSIPSKFLQAEASYDSILIDDFDIDETCIDLFIERIIVRRLETGKLEDKDGNEIDSKTLCELIFNRCSESQIKQEIKNVGLSIIVDSRKEESS